MTNRLVAAMAFAAVVISVLSLFVALSATADEAAPQTSGLSPPTGSLPIAAQATTPTTAPPPTVSVVSRPTVRVTGGDGRLEASWAGSGAIDTWQVDGPDGIMQLAASQTSFSWGQVGTGSHTVRVRASNGGSWSDWGSGTARVDDLPPPTAEAARGRLEGSYVSVLVSATSESGAERARERLERQHNQSLGILLSDDYESLRPGYWVVFAGPFDTSRDSQRACWFDLNRRSGAECYGRRLSQDRSDRDLVWGPSPN